MVGPPESNVAIALMEEDQPFDVVKANSSLDENYNRRPSSYVFEEGGDLPALSMSTSHASAASNGNNSQSSTVDVHEATSGMNKKAALNDSALSQATTLTRNVTGGRSTHTRPMSPPSRAGLDDPKDYQKGNANAPGRWRSNGRNGSPENDDEDDYADATTGNAYSNNDYSQPYNEYDEEEGDTSPPRESLARGQSYRNEMPMDERREYEDEMKALALCDYGEGSQGMPEFCDSALRAMNELCAGGGGGDGDGSTHAATYVANAESRRFDDGDASETPSASASAATRRKLRLGEKHSVHNGASGVEEQTAIEVEYVEPLYRGRGGEEDGADYSSPKRKNALLKAMTRRAKDDYKTRGKKKKKGAAEDGKGTTGDEIAELELESQSQQGSEAENRDNVYATFSSVEKRKFLQLINGGVSPTDATSKILRDRRNRDERDDDDPSVAESSIPSDYPGMHEDDENGDGRDRRSVVAVKSGKKGINKLAFWKRKNKGAAPVGSVVTPKTSPEKTAATRGDPAPERNDSGEDDDSQSTSSCEHVGDEIKKFLKEEREENRANSRAKKAAQSKTQETAVRGANEIIGDLHRSMSHNRNSNNNNESHNRPTELATADTEEEEDEDEDDNQFEKSGIKYYDAVRKDRSAEYDLDDLAGSGTTSTSSKKSRKLNIIPKSIKGSISKLKNNYASPRATPVPEEAEDDYDYDTNDGDDPQDADDYQNEVETEAEVEAETEDEVKVETETETETEQMNYDNEEYESQAASETLESNDYQNNGILQTMSKESLLDDGDVDNQLEDKKMEAQNSAIDDAMEDAIEDAMTAKLLAVAAPAAATEKVDSTNQESTVVQKVALQNNLDVDAYISETMSQMGGGGTGRSFDAISVVSGKSHKTSYTTGTNYTSHSTRSRRPGQAKVRRDKEKEALNTSGVTSKSHGWHESIEAAAARAGRVWDPEVGWREYVDPNQIEHPTDDFFGGSAAMASARRPQQQQTDVASPSEPRSPSRSVGKSPRSPARSTPGRQRKAQKLVMSPKDGRPRGWAETMKAATARFNMDGKEWDPVKGWVGLSEEEARKVGMYDGQRRDLPDDVAITADSDMQDFGIEDQLDETAKQQDRNFEFVSKDDLGDDAANNIDGEEETTVDGDQSSATKSTSKNSGRYIQIAETGSIQSHYRRSRADPNPKRMVNVKRENLDEGEADMFQKSAERQKGSGPVDLDSLYEQEPYATAFPTNQKEKIVSGPDANEVYQKIYESQSNESFDAASDFSWDADDAANETVDSRGRKPVPRLKISIRDVSSVSSRPNSNKSNSRAQSEASFDSGTSSIPKLAAPKRDTSPIRANKKRTTVSPTASMPSYSPEDSKSPFQERSPFKETITPIIVRLENKDDSIKSALQDDSTKSAQDYSTKSAQDDSTKSAQDDSTKSAQDYSTKSAQDYSTKSAQDYSTKSAQDYSTKSAQHEPHENDEYDNNPSGKASPRLSELHRLWEARTTSWDKEDSYRRESPRNESPDGAPTISHNPEWKSFLKKKVQAESAAASAATTRDMDDADERDTVFDFDVDSDANMPRSSLEKSRQRGSVSSKPGEPDDGSAFDEISELSPIRHQNDDAESDFGQNSEASTAVFQGTTFLQRLQACAAPVMKGGTNCASEGPISAHLGFLRSNPGVGGSPDKNSSPNNLMSRGKSGILQASAGMCGRPGVIVEDEEDESTIAESLPSRSPLQSPPPPNMNKKAQDKNSRSRSNPRSRQSANKDDLSSVISDGFGAKSAYLEAIAMKAAVAGGSKKKKRRSQGSEASATTATSRRSSPGSTVSNSGNAKHSEKFQQFLDRRASKDERRSTPQRPPQSPGRSEVSGRAEQYASEEMNDMMDSMAGRTQNKGRIQEEYEKTGAFPTLQSNSAPTTSDATRLAAEELAAARVEAMMQRLSAQNLEDNEAEI